MQFTIAVPTTCDAAGDSPRTLSRKAHIEMIRIKQGISDERWQELQLQRAQPQQQQPTPQQTLEDVQRQPLEYRLRHLARDRELAAPAKRKKKAKEKIDAEPLSKVL